MVRVVFGTFFFRVRLFAARRSGTELTKAALKRSIQTGAVAPLTSASLPPFFCGEALIPYLQRREWQCFLQPPIVCPAIPPRN
jgi:hypothetical protein